MKSYTDLTSFIDSVERIVAPGGNTTFWGDFLEEVGRQYPHIEGLDPEDDDMVSDDFDAWWRDFYATLDEIHDLGLDNDDWLNEAMDNEEFLTRAKELLND